MVSVEGNVAARPRQVGSEKTNVSEPSMTCREPFLQRRNRAARLTRDEVQREPVYWLDGVRHKGGVSSDQALMWNVGTCRPDAKRRAQVESLHKGASIDAGHRGGVICSSVETAEKTVEQRGDIVQLDPSVNRHEREEPVSTAKPFAISKGMVWEAFKAVRANDGAPGVDGQTLGEFAGDLANNLYRIWNRMASGSYFPPPVLRVEIPKSGGGVRELGIPTVGDRVAQAVVKRYLEDLVEPHFHPDSFGYRARRSAHDAVALARERCWRFKWVLDLDIQGFFDNLDHALVLRAVRRFTDCRWVLLYVARWLRADVVLPDGTRLARDRGNAAGRSHKPGSRQHLPASRLGPVDARDLSVLAVRTVRG